MEKDMVSIVYDPTTGKLEFTAPAEQLEQAKATAEVLIRTAHACLLPRDRVKVPDPSTSTSASPTAPQHHNPEPRAARPARRSGESSGRSGRIGSFEKVDFGITEDQHRAIHDFYTTRRPDDQKEQVVVAMFIGAKVLKRSAFDYNEIYTLMHLGGEKDLPKALDVVIDKLLKDLWVARDGKQFALKFLAEDYVTKLSAQPAV